jgi:hypothetical protein
MLAKSITYALEFNNASLIDVVKQLLLEIYPAHPFGQGITGNTPRTITEQDITALLDAVEFCMEDNARNLKQQMFLLRRMGYTMKQCVLVNYNLRYEPYLRMEIIYDVTEEDHTFLMLNFTGNTIQSVI